MKYAFLILSISLAILCSGQNHIADPFLGNRTIAAANDVLLVWQDNDSSAIHIMRHDFISFNKCESFTDSSAVVAHKRYAIPNLDPRILDAVTADVTGDEFEEILTVVVQSSDSSSIVVLSHQFSLGELNQLSSTDIGSFFSKIDMVSIQTLEIDGDINPELLISYSYTQESLNDSVYVMVIDMDSTSTPRVVLHEAMGESSRQFGSVVYDILADDFNQDGISEIVFAGIKNILIQGQQKLVFYGDIYSVDFASMNKPDLAWLQGFDNVIFNDDFNHRVRNLRLASGDFNRNFETELVIGYQLSTDNGSSDYFLIPCVVGNDLSRMDCLIDKQILAADMFEDSGNAIDLNVADFNLDKKDDLVFSWHSQSTLFELNADTVFEKISHVSSMSHGMGMDNFRNQKLAAVGDLNATGDEEFWSPEIAILGMQEANDDPNNPQPDECVLHVYQTTNCADVVRVVRKSSRRFIAPGLVFEEETPVAVLNGRFDNSGIVLGPPTVTINRDVEEILIVINAPPNHFDVIEGTAFDIGHCYNGQSCDFKSYYDQSTSSTQQITIQQNSDWALDTTLKANVEAAGNKVYSSMESKYGESFSNIQSRSTSVDFGINVLAQNDDMIFATVSDYEIWAYPVYEYGEFQGYISATNPSIQRKAWFPSKSVQGYNYLPDHEIGNILSYPSMESKIGTGRVGELIKTDNNGYLVGPSTAYEWRIKTEDFQQSGTSLEQKKGVYLGIGAQVGYEGDYSVEAAPIGLGVTATYHMAVTAGVEVSGEFVDTDLTSHRTSVMEAMQLNVEMGNVYGALTGYSIVPYAYWSRSGTFVLDYAVEPEVSPSGTVKTWWQSMYEDEPDPALMLPWRLDEEKGFDLADPLQKSQAKGIVVEPRNAVPGDTVRIYTRVHNFSLRECEDPIEVRWYMGHPDQGEIIRGVDGLTQKFTQANLGPRETEWVSMQWILPEWEGRLYAELDGEHEISEIHESNNLGWVGFGSEIISGIDNQQRHEELVLGQNVPNPFSDKTNIPFVLKDPGYVSIDVYDLMGRKVSKVLKGYFPSEAHSILFDGFTLDNGVYVYQLSVGQQLISGRMLIIR